MAAVFYKDQYCGKKEFETARSACSKKILEVSDGKVVMWIYCDNILID
jgi:hypothetical protein